MRFHLLGAGEIGRLRARCVALNPDTELVAVADVDEAATPRTAGIANTVYESAASGVPVRLSQR
jgi:glyceraldehyde-3-phosphate dehydrogenase/erythrose-4-phosphate dehydrogenase